MTLKQFFKEIKKVRYLGWENEGELIRCNGMCPIEVLASVKTGRKYNGKVSSAAKALGINDDDREKIIDMADDQAAKQRKRIAAILGVE